MMGTFPELVCVRAHEGLSEVSVDMSHRKREQLLELFFTILQIYLLKNTLGKKTVKMSIMPSLYLGIIYIDKVPEADPHEQS